MCTDQRSQTPKGRGLRQPAKKVTHKLEPVTLLQERLPSNWGRRKRRLERIPAAVAAEGMMKTQKGEPLTLEEYIGADLGFLPGETIPKRAGQSEQQ